jgi:hypothetical protein
MIKNSVLLSKENFQIVKIYTTVLFFFFISLPDLIDSLRTQKEDGGGVFDSR